MDYLIVPDNIKVFEMKVDSYSIFGIELSSADSLICFHAICGVIGNDNC